MLLAIIFGVLIPGARRAPGAMFVTACVCWGTGFALLLTAKAPALWRRQWFSFGSLQMTPGHRRVYRAAYALMAAGCLVASGFVVMTLRIGTQ